jgi:TRAP-type C4-dicarboxylate transport system permease small subunit
MGRDEILHVFSTWYEAGMGWAGIGKRSMVFVGVVMRYLVSSPLSVLFFL